MSIELVLLGEILQLSSDPDCSLEQFGQKVATSPQLAAEVVRVSNSALYGMEGKITRLERAVLILGMRTVSDIASAVLVSRKMKSANVGPISGDALWMHSLEIGVAAQLVARCLSLPLESEAYLTGLLHDLGVMELYETHGQKYCEVLSRSMNEGVALVNLEQEILGETHASRMLVSASEWGFPEALREAIGYHDTPFEAPDAARSLALLVRSAHVIVEEPSEGWSDVPPGEEDERILAELDLQADDVEDIRSLMDERMKELAPLFG